MLAAALAAYPALVAGVLTPLAGSIAALALLSLLLPLLWSGRGAWLPVLLLATEYVLVETSGRAGGGSVIGFAAGLVVVCELLFWSAELPRRGRVDSAVVSMRLLWLTVVLVATGLLALLALLATAVRLDSALDATLLGTFAATLLLAIPYALLHRRDRGE